MSRTLRSSSPWIPLAAVSVVGLALFVAHRLGSRVPELGTLDPVVAAPAERLEVVQLQPGETFGEVLGREEVGWSEQNALLLAFREQANPRRMRDGTPITFHWLPGEDWLRGMDVALSKDETVRLLRDGVGWSSALVQTPVWVDTVYVSGVVQNLFWNAVTGNPQLTSVSQADRFQMMDWLDKVFQWQVDFSRQVRAGDTYRFALEREIRPDGSMRSGHLLAAEYVNQGTPYRAIWFDPNGDGEGTFYDEDGKSVRRAFLLKPIPLSRISSRYSTARLHPILHTIRAHRGVDFAASIGTPIQATGDGVVIYADWKGDLGNLVEIRHPNGWVTRYGHMSRFGPGIRVGTRVKQGQTVGYVGMTGLATGPHCHYEMRQNGEALDPLSIRLPPGDPVPGSDWGRWVLESRKRLELLRSLPGPPILRMADTPDGDGTESVAGQGRD